MSELSAALAQAVYSPDSLCTARWELDLVELPIIASCLDAPDEPETPQEGTTEGRVVYIVISATEMQASSAYDHTQNR